MEKKEVVLMPIETKEEEVIWISDDEFNICQGEVTALSDNDGNEAVEEVVLVPADEKETKEEEIIVISDDEFDVPQREAILSSDDDIPDSMKEIVSLIWTPKFDTHRYHLRRNEPFRTVFKALSKEYKLPVEQIQILKNYDDVYPTDTLESLNLSALDDLFAGLKIKIKTAPEDLKSQGTGDIRVNIILQDRNKPLVFFMNPMQPLKILLKACAKEVGRPEENVKLSYDGKNVTKKDTLNSLDIIDEVWFILI